MATRNRRYAGRARACTLAEQLESIGHAVSHVVVGQILKAQGYSLQGNAKVIEGNQSPDRNAQFEHINATVTAALAAHQPVISVDTKKKELVGAYKNAGQTWEPGGKPVQVKVQLNNLSRAPPV